MKILNVTENFVKEAHAAACSEWKQKIEKQFPNIFPRKITDRIRNWNDILYLSGKNEDEFLPFRNARTKHEKSQNALAKIQIISEVLNEGWIPDFTATNQYKYYPFFEKKPSGWVCLSFDLGFCVARAGAGMYFKSSELAEFAGKTFIEIYKEFLPN
jgi:hypothetical protein